MIFWSYIFVGKYLILCYVIVRNLMVNIIKMGRWDFGRFYTENLFANTKG